jgi:hypothetical protein
MFAKPRRLAVGAAALTPVVSIGLPAVAHAATVPPPAPAKNACIANALSAAQVAAGVQSVMVCFETKQQADAAISGGGGPVTSTFGSGFPMATFYSTRSMDPSGSLTMYGGACTDYLYSVPPAWEQYMVAWAPQRCTSAKHYTADNFGGQAVYTSGSPYYFADPLLRNVHSIKFG